jgi:hypothetical protein
MRSGQRQGTAQRIHKLRSLASVALNGLVVARVAHRIGLKRMGRIVVLATEGYLSERARAHRHA